VRIFRISSAAVNIAPFGMAWHQQLGIHQDFRRMSASISGSESCASPDRDLISIWQPDHIMICRQVEP
jgi:hypothetical protein